VLTAAHLARRSLATVFSDYCNSGRDIGLTLTYVLLDTEMTIQLTIHRRHDKGKGKVDLYSA